MKKIEKISKKIEHLMDLADEYAECALYEKETDINLAKAYNSASIQFMDIVKLLHNAVVNIIDDYRREHGEPPADMLVIYNYLHEQHIEKASEVKVLQSMFKE